MGPEYTRTDEVLLKIEDVSLSFGPAKILNGVTAQIKDITRPGMQQGQVVALLGPSGIGKTQLLRIIAGLQSPTSGRVYIEDDQRKVIPTRRGLVGVVAQNYVLFANRRVLSQLTVAGRQAGLSREEAREKALNLLERFGLRDRADFFPAKLSGGQRQRVAIAQQMMCSEHLLIMDEPFTGLDPVMTEEVCALITEVSQRDELNTLLIITHNIAEAISVADTLWIMGRSRDTGGRAIPGAKIQMEIDLIAADLAWHKDIQLTKEFSEMVRYVKERFRTL